MDSYSFIHIEDESHILTDTSTGDTLFCFCVFFLLLLFVHTRPTSYGENDSPIIAEPLDRAGWLVLLHSHSGAQLFHRSNNLLGLFLGNVLLHHLGCALDKLLAIH